MFGQQGAIRSDVSEINMTVHTGPRADGIPNSIDTNYLSENARLKFKITIIWDYLIWIPHPPASGSSRRTHGEWKPIAGREEEAIRIDYFYTNEELTTTTPPATTAEPEPTTTTTTTTTPEPIPQENSAPTLISATPYTNQLVLSWQDAGLSYVLSDGTIENVLSYRLFLRHGPEKNYEHRDIYINSVDSDRYGPANTFDVYDDDGRKIESGIGNLTSTPQGDGVPPIYTWVIDLNDDPFYTGTIPEVRIRGNYDSTFMTHYSDNIPVTFSTRSATTTTTTTTSTTTPEPIKEACFVSMGSIVVGSTVVVPYSWTNPEIDGINAQTPDTCSVKANVGCNDMNVESTWRFTTPTSITFDGRPTGTTPDLGSLILSSMDSLFVAYGSSFHIFDHNDNEIARFTGPCLIINDAVRRYYKNERIRGDSTNPNIGEDIRGNLSTRPSSLGGNWGDYITNDRVFFTDELDDLPNDSFYNIREPLIRLNAIASTRDVHRFEIKCGVTTTPPPLALLQQLHSHYSQKMVLPTLLEKVIFNTYLSTTKLMKYSH